MAIGEFAKNVESSLETNVGQAKHTTNATTMFY